MPPDGDASYTIILMRHGETAWNRERRVMGNADVPLNEQGRAQCRRAAEVLARCEVDAIVSSPLVRSSESATIVAGVLGVGVEYDEGLEEVRFGAWQGKTYDEIVVEPAYRRYAKEPLTEPTPGGETIVDVQRRGLASIARVAGAGTLLVVSHGDIIRSLVCHYLGMPLGEYRRVRIDNCGLTAVGVDGDRSQVKFLNTLADPERAWDRSHWSR